MMLCSFRLIGLLLVRVAILRAALGALAVLLLGIFLLSGCPVACGLIAGPTAVGSFVATAGQIVAWGSAFRPSFTLHFWCFPNLRLDSDRF
jgi:hypothetical protein